MADISKINVNGTEYNIKDAEARNQGPSLPTGGTIGQVLVKNSNVDGDAGWYSPGHYPVDKWYLTETVYETDVIAAYQFINQPDESTAITNINANGSYAMSKIDSPIWSADNGVYFPGTYTTKIGYTVPFSEDTVYSVIGGYKCDGTANGVILLYINSGTKAFHIFEGDGIWKPGAETYYRGGPGITNYNDNVKVAYHSTKYIKGILGFSYNSRKIYHNGVSLSTNILTTKVGEGGPGIVDNGGYLFNGIGRKANGVYTACSSSGHSISCIAFYSRDLTDTEHAQIADNIRNIGGAYE